MSADTPPEVTAEIVDQAHAFLRHYTRGELRFGDNFCDIKYIVEPDTGRLIAPAEPAMFLSLDTVLFIPDMSDDALQLQVTVCEIEDRGDFGQSADRWRIYHGDPPFARWAMHSINAAKFRGHVIDGDAIMRVNPITVLETMICKHFNTEDVDTLRTLARLHAHVEIEDPRVVGVDPLGLDVRGRFDVVRVPFPQPLGEWTDIPDFWEAFAEAHPQDEDEEAADTPARPEESA